MPGPDGIPSMASKYANDVGAVIWMGVLEVLSSSNAEEVLTEAFQSMQHAEAHAFNHSMLRCFPKKQSGEDEKGNNVVALKPLGH